jgi:plastocyanin domain-containing protein
MGGRFVTIIVADGRVKRIRFARRDGMPPPPHWRCPDCGDPCSCPPEVRAFNLPHQRCGLKKEIT